jgi:2-formylbenzoate dehydrogenase
MTSVRAGSASPQERSYGAAYEAITAELREIRERNWALIIDGAGRPAIRGREYTTLDPATEEPLAQVPDGDGDDVALAVEAAQRGFEVWRRRSSTDRAKALREVADRLRENLDELALLDCLDAGMPISSARADVHRAADLMSMYADWALMVKGETVPASAAGFHYTRPEPYGVVGRIVPFNHPTLFAAAKTAAPLLAGNSVVIKPSPQAPLSALRVGELFAEVLPRGVVNVVTGSEAATGAALARHPDVRRLAFIGSEATGRAIQALGAEGAVKHVTLELGGKNAMVVLSDADLERAAVGAVRGMNFTASQGQSCGSNSRLLLHESVADDVVARVVELVEQIHVGLPIDATTEMGPLVSRQQHDRVTSYIEIGLAEGAVVATGGSRPRHLPAGSFLEPTVFTGVRPHMRIAQEEIFGPVLSVLTFGDDDEALRVANDVRYGLTASVWTNDLKRAHSFIEGFEAGVVWVNDSGRHFGGVPFGGVKASGVGREDAVDEVLSFTQTKAVNMQFL